VTSLDIFENFGIVDYRMKSVHRNRRREGEDAYLKEVVRCFVTYCGKGKNFSSKVSREGVSK